MDSFFEKLKAMPDKITHQYNSAPAQHIEHRPVARLERMEMPSMGAGLRIRKRTRKSRFGAIPNGATVAYKQNNNSGPVLVNAATAKRLMVNRVDPIYHGGRKRTRKN